MCLSRSLLCFKHCCSSSIFCKAIPENCPICNNIITQFLLEPFAIPCPLVNAKDHPNCLVVRPSNGSFVDNYNVNDDLHIAITDSNGNVIEYDKCGLVKNDNNKWTNCAAIALIPDSWQIFWDEVLTEMCNDTKWNFKNYNDVSFNCFNFIISFLDNLKYKNIQCMNKEDLCKVFIMPKLNSILKYVSLYNRLRNENFYIQE